MCIIIIFGQIDAGLNIMYNKIVLYFYRDSVWERGRCVWSGANEETVGVCMP